MYIDESKFKTKKELFDFLVNNKELLINQKKSVTKFADPFLYSPSYVNKDKSGIIKANNPIDATNLTELNVVSIINTTNWMDSHMDVHIPGLWDKSLKENKKIMLIQEHKMSEFSKIIAGSKDVKAFVRNYSWSELGENITGETQALVFDSIVRKIRNEFMFNQYAEGYVDNHSVGMRYVQLVMAINNDNYGAEFEAWEKYYPMVANQELAEESGYFWAVKEAKVVEGSAVPLGSNQITPTLENNKNEPINFTQNEPSNDTPKYDYRAMAEKININ